MTKDEVFDEYVTWRSQNGWDEEEYSFNDYLNDINETGEWEPVEGSMDEADVPAESEDLTETDVQDMSDDELKALAKKEIGTGRLNVRKFNGILDQNEMSDIVDADDFMKVGKYNTLRGSGLAKLVDSLDSEQIRELCFNLGIRPQLEAEVTEADAPVERDARDDVLAAVEDGFLTYEDVATACLKWMSNDDVKAMIKANDWAIADDEMFDESETIDESENAADIVEQAMDNVSEKYGIELELEYEAGFGDEYYTVVNSEEGYAISSIGAEECTSVKAVEKRIEKDIKYREEHPEEFDLDDNITESASEPSIADQIADEILNAMATKGLDSTNYDEVEKFCEDGFISQIAKDKEFIWWIEEDPVTTFKVVVDQM